MCLSYGGHSWKLERVERKILFPPLHCSRSGMQLVFEPKTEWCRGSHRTQPTFAHPFLSCIPFQWADKKTLFWLVSIIFCASSSSGSPRGKMGWVARQDYGITSPLTLIPSIPVFKSHPFPIVPSRDDLEQGLGKQKELGNEAMAKCHLGDIFSFLNKLYFHSVCRAYGLCAVNKMMEMPQRSLPRWLHLCAFCSRGVP